MENYDDITGNVFGVFFFFPDKIFISCHVS